MDPQAPGFTLRPLQILLEAAASTAVAANTDGYEFMLNML